MKKKAKNSLHVSIYCEVTENESLFKHAYMENFIHEHIWWWNIVDVKILIEIEEMMLFIIRYVNFLSTHSKVIFSPHQNISREGGYWKLRQNILNLFASTSSSLALLMTDINYDDIDIKFAFMTFFLTLTKSQSHNFLPSTEAFFVCAISQMPMP
jgi:hypothetical protein